MDDYYGFFEDTGGIITYDYDGCNEKLIEQACSNPSEEYCMYCFYCGMPLPLKKKDSTYAKAHQHDHFPRPRPLGGTNVVPACSACHQWKDSLGVLTWPVKFVTDQASDLSKDENKYYLKALDQLLSQAPLEEGLGTWLNVPLAVWGTWAPGTRILWARGIRIYWFMAERTSPRQDSAKAPGALEERGPSLFDLFQEALPVNPC